MRTRNRWFVIYLSHMTMNFPHVMDYKTIDRERTRRLYRCRLIGGWMSTYSNHLLFMRMQSHLGDELRVFITVSDWQRPSICMQNIFMHTYIRVCQRIATNTEKHLQTSQFKDHGRTVGKVFANKSTSSAFWKNPTSFVYIYQDL